MCGTTQRPGPGDKVASKGQRVEWVLVRVCERECLWRKCVCMHACLCFLMCVCVCVCTWEFRLMVTHPAVTLNNFSVSARGARLLSARLTGREGGWERPHPLSQIYSQGHRQEVEAAGALLSSQWKHKPWNSLINRKLTMCQSGHSTLQSKFKS